MHFVGFQKYGMEENARYEQHKTLISVFHRAFFKVNHLYWPTNALNFIKVKG